MVTYQRMMTRVFGNQLGRNIEVYNDDMVIKTARDTSHAADLTKIFAQLRKHGLRLNPLKCAFRVQAAKFLGFMLTQRGIHANPEKCRAVLEMRTPTCLKEVQ